MSKFDDFIKCLGEKDMEDIAQILIGKLITFVCFFLRVRGHVR